MFEILSFKHKISMVTFRTIFFFSGFISESELGTSVPETQQVQGGVAVRAGGGWGYSFKKPLQTVHFGRQRF